MTDSYKGKWWIPGKNKNKMDGILFERSDGPYTEFSLGIKTNVDNDVFLEDSRTTFDICGETLEEGSVILEDCFVESRDVSLPSNTVDLTIVVNGVNWNPEEEG